MRAGAVITQVGVESQILVGFHRVHTLILKLVGANLVLESDAAALLPHIDKNTLSFFTDHLQRVLQLPAAIATERPEYITGQTFRMNTDQYVLFSRHVPLDQRDMLGVIDQIDVADDPEVAELGR